MSINPSIALFKTPELFQRRGPPFYGVVSYDSSSLRQLISLNSSSTFSAFCIVYLHHHVFLLTYRFLSIYLFPRKSLLLLDSLCLAGPGIILLPPSPTNSTITILLLQLAQPQPYHQHVDHHLHRQLREIPPFLLVPIMRGLPRPQNPLTSLRPRTARTLHLRTPTPAATTSTTNTPSHPSHVHCPR